MKIILFNFITIPCNSPFFMYCYILFAYLYVYIVVYYSIAYGKAHLNKDGVVPLCLGIYVSSKVCSYSLNNVIHS